MGELYGTCALLAAVLFFVLLQKFESRFGKVDKELGEIKKRMDDLLKAQEKMASGPVRAKEDVTAETLDNTDILPYATEELPDSTVTALKEEKAVSYFALSAPLKDGSGILLDRTAASSGVDKAVFQAVMNGVTVNRLS